MPTPNHTLDPVWEQSYSSGRTVRYPWDAIVTHVFRNAPRDKPRHEARILELGCGPAPNLLFAAREGFDVVGLDGSASAIAMARQRFAEAGLRGQFLVGDFTEPLPFASESFDMALDRAAITCVSFADARRTLTEVRRVLRPGGTFFFCPYSDRSGSAVAGRLHPDGLVTDIASGGLEGVGQLCFWGRRDLLEAFAYGWTLLEVEHVESEKMLGPVSTIRAEWRVTARRV